MKIGFSLGRCIRDIVLKKVDIDDVAFVITATNISELSQLENVIFFYLDEPSYLKDLDKDECLTVAHNLWNSSRLIQPRKQGLHRHKQPENSVWVDLFPTVLSENQSVKDAWSRYRLMIHMVENMETDILCSL